MRGYQFFEKREASVSSEIGLSEGDIVCPETMYTLELVPRPNYYVLIRKDTDTEKWKLARSPSRSLFQQYQSTTGAVFQGDFICGLLLLFRVLLSSLTTVFSRRTIHVFLGFESLEILSLDTFENVVPTLLRYK